MGRHVYLGHARYIGKRFLQIQRRLLQHIIRKSQIHGALMYQNTHHLNAKRQLRIRAASQDRQPKIQSSQVEESLQRIMEQTNNDCRFSDPPFDKFPTSATFACWKISFKIEVCTCSQFLTECLLWIKEVGLVDSADDLKSLCSVRGIQMPNFEVLDAKIASALNRIIHNTNSRGRSVWRNKKPQQEDRLLRGRQIAYLIYEYFRVT